MCGGGGAFSDVICSLGRTGHVPPRLVLRLCLIWSPPCPLPTTASTVMSSITRRLFRSPSALLLGSCETPQLEERGETLLRFGLRRSGKISGRKSTGAFP